MFQYQQLRLAARLQRVCAMSPNTSANAISLLIHGCVVVVLLTLTTSKPVEKEIRRAMSVIGLREPLWSGKPGGGGGGDNSSTPATRGSLPRPARRQFTPPMVSILNFEQKLPVAPTLIISADMPDMRLAQLGDPIGNEGLPSGGRGSRGGIGDGKSGGVGPATGPGSGSDDWTGGSGAKHSGGGVTAPILLSKIEPEFSEEARKAKLQGTVVLVAEVDTEGRVRRMRIVQSLGLGLDEKAMEAVNQWKFRPGLKNGKPAVVAAVIEVSFRLL